MGFFPGTALPFLGRVAEQQGGQGNGGCSGLLRWEDECGGGGGRVVWRAAAFLWITSLISQGRNLRGRCRLISPV